MSGQIIQKRKALSKAQTRKRLLQYKKLKKEFELTIKDIPLENAKGSLELIREKIDQVIAHYTSLLT